MHIVAALVVASFALLAAGKGIASDEGRAIAPRRPPDGPGGDPNT